MKTKDYNKAEEVEAFHRTTPDKETEDAAVVLRVGLVGTVIGAVIYGLLSALLGFLWAAFIFLTLFLILNGVINYYEATEND